MSHRVIESWLRTAPQWLRNCASSMAFFGLLRCGLRRSYCALRRSTDASRSKRVAFFVNASGRASNYLSASGHVSVTGHVIVSGHVTAEGLSGHVTGHVLVSRVSSHGHMLSLAWMHVLGSRASSQGHAAVARPSVLEACVLSQGHVLSYRPPEV